MPLPLSVKQHMELRRLQAINPALGTLAFEIAGAFDATRLDNPELAAVMLEALCRRVVEAEPGAIDSLLTHLQNFERMGCLEIADSQGYQVRLDRLRKSVA